MPRRRRSRAAEAVHERGAPDRVAVLRSASRLALERRAAAGAAQKPVAEGAGKPAAPRPPRPAAPAAFDRAGRTGHRRRATPSSWDEAIALYAKAVKLKPSYVEGYWYQGTAYYTLEKFTECRDQFRTVARLAPKNGAAQAFLGLCEFALKDYDRSLQHLLQSRILGVGDTPDLGSVARYHAGRPDDASGAIRAGARDARRVRGRRGRQPAGRSRRWGSRRCAWRCCRRRPCPTAASGS